eukprot:jgi/Botrbrau1/20013/Bobra.200_1s0019.1
MNSKKKKDPPELQLNRQETMDEGKLRKILGLTDLDKTDRDLPGPGPAPTVHRDLDDIKYLPPILKQIPPLQVLWPGIDHDHCPRNLEGDPKKDPPRAPGNSNAGPGSAAADNQTDATTIVCQALQ